MAYGITAITTTTNTGNNNIDGIVGDLKWTDQTINYSYIENFNHYGPAYDWEKYEGRYGMEALTTTPRHNMNKWIDNVEQVSNIDLVENLFDPSVSTIKIASMHDTYDYYDSYYPNSFNYQDRAYAPNEYEFGGDIWLSWGNNNYNGNAPEWGNLTQWYNHSTGVQLLKSLGLRSSEEAYNRTGDTPMDPEKNTIEYSMMGYNPQEGEAEWSQHSQSLMIYDIAALQSLYGADFSDATNTTYTFSTSTGEMFMNGAGQGVPDQNYIFRTIWDQGGVDTYDFSNYTTPALISLFPGGFSDLDIHSNFQNARFLINESSSYMYHARGNVFNAIQHEGDNRSLIENANGGSNDDTLLGNKGDNVLNGMNGNDTLYGDEGNDTLKGWNGADTMYGYHGNDTYYVENVRDKVFENEEDTGFDTIFTKISYAMPRFIEELIQTGTSAINAVGNDSANKIVGNNANNIIDAAEGADIIDGGIGADTMYGGTGHDVYYVDNMGDKIMEADDPWASDLVYSKISYTLPQNVTSLQLEVGAINATGNNEYNWIHGNNVDNIINGMDGDDALIGGLGNDTLIGWNGADGMYGNDGNDTFMIENVGDSVYEYGGQGTDLISSKVSFDISANVENITLTGTAAINSTGNAYANVMIGNSAINNLNGGASNDKLDGQLGNDILTGGIGNDTFKFTVKGSVDSIKDYNVAADTIQLENAVFTSLTTNGVLNAANFKVGTAAADNNDFVIYNKTSGSLMYDADGNGAASATQIATLTAGLAMTAADIVVI